MYLIVNALIVNENKIFSGGLTIKDSIIEKIFEGNQIPQVSNNYKKIDAQGNLLIPGIIDDQVHFREPGLEYKADIFSESQAAVAGGITSFMEMPNTKPQAVTNNLLEEKFKIADEKSFANFSFYLGATNENLEEILKVDNSKVCGIKIFMGSSTGNMLVDKEETLIEIFKNSKSLIATHCEDEEIIRKNTEIYRSKFGEKVPFQFHSLIRSEEACYKSSAKAVELATKYNSRLHILHVSSAKEINLFRNNISAKGKKITAEVCVHHLFFNSDDYEKYGSRIKWNPSIKTKFDQEALLKAVSDNFVDVIATDHAPHTLEEKQNNYFNCPSGGPLVQHSLVAMLELYHNQKIKLEKIVEKMCHTPSDIFKIDKRGYIREGYWADLAIVNLNSEWTVNKENILYKCKWSPFENMKFKSKVTHTFVNGNLVFEKDKINLEYRGKRLLFNN